MKTLKQYRLTNPARPVAGVAGTDVAPSHRLGYYVIAASEAEAIAIAQKRPELEGQTLEVEQVRGDVLPIIANVQETSNAIA